MRKTDTKLVNTHGSAKFRLALIDIDTKYRQLNKITEPEVW